MCSIHQPDFFPWLGVFDKIRKSDIFVILDDVQIVKTGSSYSNRVSFNVNGMSKDFTAPIKRESGVQDINEVQFVDTNWREKLKKTFQANYAKSKNFNLYKDRVFELIDCNTSSLSEYNINALKGMCEILDIEYKQKFILSSSLNISTRSEQRIIDICNVSSCNEYLSGHGAKAYQKVENFHKNGVRLTYQDFCHPKYEQFKSKGGFVMGLSAIDYIFEGL